MITAVYLSNRNIQVVVGYEGSTTASIREVYEIQAPQNSIINGVITDPESLSACLEGFWKKMQLSHKNVKLVLNSSQFSAKIVKMPLLKAKKMYQNLALEFSGSNQEGDLYGYYVLERSKAKGTCEVFASVMERRFLEEYLELFQSVGIKLISVEAALGCAAHLMGRLKQLNNKLAIVQILDGYNLISMLMQDGKYLYSSVNRLLYERGSEEFFREAARCVSGIIQFASAQKIQGVIKDIYWAGFSEEEHSAFLEDIYEMVGDQLKLYTLGQEEIIRIANHEVQFSDWVYPISSLLSTQKEYNQLEYYKKTLPGARKRSEQFRILAPVMFTFIICVAATLGLWGFYQMIHNQRVHAGSYNLDSETVMLVEEYDQLNKENEINQDRYQTVLKARDHITSYPYMDQQVRQVFKSCRSGLAGNPSIVIRSFDGDIGMVQVDASASKVEVIHQLISNLEKDQHFDKIDYFGYAYVEDTKRWSMNLTCYLSSQAKEEDTNED